MVDFEPCPFCGCKNIYLIDEEEPFYNKVPAIFCNGCKTITKMENDTPYLSDEKTYEYLLEKLTEKWNRRHYARHK